jgi:hemolysin activation/secretion protein
MLVLSVLKMKSKVLACMAMRLALLLPLWAQAQEANVFDILEYRIEGNSLLDDAVVETAVTPYLGEQRSLKDIESARAGLELQYRDRGYLTVLVAIPEQKVDSGVVRLEVTEAPVSRVRVVGAEYTLPSAIKERLGALVEGKVPNFVEFQKSLAQINQSNDIKVSPVLKPGKVPGTVEVQLDVDDQLPLHGSVEANDRQSLNTTASRLNASVRYDNLWQRGHSLGVSAQYAPQAPEETRLVSLNYLMPLGRDGDALMLYAVRSRSQFATIYNAPGLGVLGNAQILGARYNLPLRVEDDYIQSLSLGMDYKNLQQASGLNGVNSDDPAIQYVPLTLGYKGIWTAANAAPSTLDVNAVLGLRGLLGNSDAAFEAKKPGVSGISSNFVALRTTYHHTSAWGKWQLGSHLEAQLASGPLLDSEQYSVGGVDTVRGYYEGERKGDQALRFSFELSSPGIKLGDWGGTWRANGLAFVDEVVVETLQPALGQQSHYALAGAGVGLRIAGPRGLSFSMDAARALSDGDVAGGGTKAGQWRMHSRLSVEF